MGLASLAQLLYTLMIKRDTINEDLGLLTKVHKQKGVTSGSGNYFGKVESYEKDMLTSDKKSFTRHDK